MGGGPWLCGAVQDLGALKTPCTVLCHLEQEAAWTYARPLFYFLPQQGSGRFLPPFIRPDSLEPVERVDPDGGCGQHREISSGSPTTGLRFSGADAQGSWWDLHTFLKPTHLVALMRQGQLCCCGCRSGGHRPEGGGCASTGSRQGSGWRLVVVAGEDLATGSLQQKLGRAAFANCHCGRFQATDVRSPT